MQPFRPPAWRLMREPEVIAAVGLSRSSIRRRVERGEFPRPVKLGSGQTAAVAWREDEILSWVEERQAGNHWGPTPGEAA